jgi:1-deoxyxylulose-5-phosphate synthase
VKYRSLGRSGLKVSEICLGTMTFGSQSDEAESRAILDRAAELGVDFIDTADCYPAPISTQTVGRTEEIVGAWLKGKRDRFVVGTKCYWPTGTGPRDRGNSRHHIVQAAEASLRRLQTDVIDLYQVHAMDADTPLDETLRALDDLIRAGKVRYAGCSNFQAWEMALALREAERLGLPALTSTQPRYNLLHREIEADLLPLCQAQGIGVIVYNPLAGGMLTGKHAPGKEPDRASRFGSQMGAVGELYRRRYWEGRAAADVADVREFMESRGKSLTSAAIAWVLQQPGISAAIVGASRAGQLESSLAGSGLALDDQEQTVLDDLWYRLPRTRPEPLPRAAAARQELLVDNLPSAI